MKANNLLELTRFTPDKHLDLRNQASVAISAAIADIAAAMDACGARIVVGDESEKARKAVSLLELEGWAWLGYRWAEPCEPFRDRAAAAIKTLEKLGYTFGGGSLWKPPVGSPPEWVCLNPLVVPDATPTDPKSTVDALAAACTPLELMAWAGYLRALADARMAYQ